MSEREEWVTGERCYRDEGGESGQRFAAGGHLGPAIGRREEGRQHRASALGGRHLGATQQVDSSEDMSHLD
jgi:hypothetical protein